MYCARALSYLVLFLNSMKINEDQWSVFPWFQSFARIRNYPYMLQCLSPSDTSRLCWPAQSDLEKVRRLMMIDEHGINVCRNVVSFPPWTQCARFLSLAAFNIDDIEIPRSTQVVAIAWVYGTPMLLWQEALAVRQGLLPWDTLRIVSSREIMSPIRHSMSRSMPLSTIPIHIQRSTNIHSHSYPQLSIAIHGP